jgi:ribose 5-phosphate isomerase B
MADKSNAVAARRIVIASDHAGVPLKLEITKHLEAMGAAIFDLGTHDASVSVDYPVYAAKVARAITDGTAPEGILVCGTGVGVGIAANKFRGVRAAIVSEPRSARLARQHNDANVLCMGARIVGVELAKEIVDAWLDATFEGGRHQRRVDQISNIELEE